MTDHNTTIKTYSWRNISATTIILLLLIVPLNLSLGSQAREAIVKQVIDGNTIKLDSGEIIRYIGVTNSSTEFNRNLVEGKRVRLEFDEQRLDSEGHILAYVYIDEVFVNAEIIQKGYGSILLLSPNTKFAEDFLKLEKEARSAKIGIWSDVKPEPTQNICETETISSLLDRILSLEREVEELKAKIDELTEIIDALKLVNDDEIRSISQKGTEKEANIPLDKKSIVYVSAKAGKKYHKDGCRFLGENVKPMTLENAEKKGYEPCKFCFSKSSKDDHQK